MTTTYTICQAPKFAGMRDWDCSRCGRQEVKPVFLAETGGPAMAYGSGCAALLLGRPQSDGRKVRDEAAAIEREAARVAEMVQERRDRYSRALVAFQADLPGEDGDLLSARQTYHRSGGVAVHGLFPAWLARVAETGDLDA